MRKEWLEYLKNKDLEELCLSLFIDDYNRELFTIIILNSERKELIQLITEQLKIYFKGR
nr:MAG: hypothetical protein [uncultured archaeon]